ncbi:MAG TPA: helicase C-terminal domain-containing protein [Candidatus Limnocylindria bacterium]|nr:helicase C-terminal domain-containing protein [Candidatus Limnocylindria bacterium]
MDLVALDLETTGFDPEADRIVEIGAVRLRLDADGAVTLGERFSSLVDPGGPLAAVITRLTGIRDEDLAGAPTAAVALAGLDAFLGDAVIVGHNVGFDLGFLERGGLAPRDRLDTVELASILMPTAPTYALQALAAGAGILPLAAHRALDDALTCAALLGDLARRARTLAPDVLGELQAHAALLGAPFTAFFGAALAAALRGAWDPGRPTAARAVRTPSPPADALAVGAVFATDGPLARSLTGYEERIQQRDLASAIERTFREGGPLVAEAGTGVGKSLAYLVPAVARALAGERVIVSTHTLPLQDQLVRKDLPALQAALGTDVAVTVLKGRSNYLCPRRWQQFRGTAASREEARLLMKTIVWRGMTASGDRAELNLLGAESDHWSRISADDETCDARRCARVAGGCYLQRAREAAAKAGLVVTNHALLLQDARMRGALLPAAEHLVVDEAHRLEEVATDAFGLALEERLVRRALDRVSRAPAVIAALRDDRVDAAETVRREVAAAHERTGELFGALGAVLDPRALEDRLRVTGGLRASDERWLPVELAGERLADGVAGVAAAAERLAARCTDEDEQAELASGVSELTGIRIAIARGIHAPRPSDIVWLERSVDGAVSLRVAPSHLGDAIRRGLVETHRSAVFTSATLAVGDSFAFALDRFGVSDLADARAFGSPFEYAKQAILVVPDEGALPNEPGFADEAAVVIAEIGRALEGRTLVLFTSHSSMRDVAARLGPLEESGIAVLTQGVDGSRRALLERFAAGRAVLLGTQSFWEGVDLPGDILECVVIARLPFAVPDDPLVQGRSERYEDPFRQFHLPQVALRLRQGFGRLIRSRTDRGAVVLLDRRALLREYGAVLLAALPDARVRRVPQEAIAATVAQFCGR